MIEDRKPEALAWLARQFIGVNQAGNNEIVNRMRRAADGVASGEPWCVCFVQYLAGEVDELWDVMGIATRRQRLVKTESSQMLWNNAGPEQKSDTPVAGSVVVWRLDGDHSLGHCGIVIALTADSGIITVEGNTSAAPGTTDAERNGRGVWQKHRVNGDIPGFTRLGYLRPWS